MLIMDIIGILFFLFLIYYTFCQLCITIQALRTTAGDSRKKNRSSPYQQELSVVVYSHNNEEKIVDLIETLKKQDYPQDKYSINIILDNCTDNSSKVVEILSGTRIWRINTDVKPIGRMKSVAWLLERIISSENTNTFVFLNAEHLVRPDFLSSVNIATLASPLVIGEILPLTATPNFLTKIALIDNKFKNKIQINGRKSASLGNILDAELFAIKQEVLEKIDFPVIDYGFEEYEYSIRLAKAKIPLAYSRNICAYQELSENFDSLVLNKFKIRYKNLLTFKNNFSALFSTLNFRTKELILSLIYPSSTAYLALIFLALAVNLNNYGSLFARIINIKIILLTLFWYLFSKFISTFVVKLSLNEYKTLISYMFLRPIIFVVSFSKGFKVKIDLKFKLPKRNIPAKEGIKTIANATVTNGQKELPCNIEVRESGDYKQIIFIFKDKKLYSNKHFNADAALAEIIEKLKAHGFALKVCQNCGYYCTNEKLKSKFDSEQGYCLYDNVNSDSKANEHTYIWNTCLNIIPIQAKNYVMQKLGKDEEN